MRKFVEKEDRSKDLINNCPGNSENLKLQGSLRALLLLCFLSRDSPQKLFSKVAVLKCRKIPLETPTSEYIPLIAATKCDHLRCSL